MTTTSATSPTATPSLAQTPGSSGSLDRLLTRVVVTGAGRGLGRAFVDALLDRGALEVVATARSSAALAELSGVERVSARALDLTDRASIACLAEEVGPVTLLISSAGAAAFAPLLDADRDDVVRELETNVIGTLDLIRALVPTMPNGSAIMSILSLLSLAATPAMGGYSASKAASHSMVQALRPGLRERGISVTGVYPGAIDTDMLADVEMPKASHRSVAEAALDGVLAGEEDVFPDPMAARMAGVWRTDPKAFERAFAEL